MKNLANLADNSLSQNANFWAKLKALFCLVKTGEGLFCRAKRCRCDRDVGRFCLADLG